MESPSAGNREITLIEIARRAEASGRRLTTLLAERIEELELGLSALVEQVLSDPRWQRLESSWRSLSGACGMLEGRLDAAGLAEVRLFALDISGDELVEDLLTQTRHQEIHRKLYVQTYDQLIGDATSGFPAQAPRCYPLSLLVLDFPVRLRERNRREGSARRDREDTRGTIGVDTLRELCRVAEKCFFMVLSGVEPASLIGQELSKPGFRGLADVEEPERLLTGDDFRVLHEFQASEFARWAGLALPRVLVRPSWHGTWLRKHGFRLRLSVESQVKGELELWGNAAFALLEVYIRAQRRDGWFAETLGLERSTRSLDSQADKLSETDLGRMTRVLAGEFSISAGDTFQFPGVDYAFSVSDDAIFSRKGLLGLYSRPLGTDPFLLSGSSLSQVVAARRRQAEERDPRAESEQLSAQFQNMLCVCKLAHIIKLKLDRILGSQKSKEELEGEISELLRRHCSARSTKWNSELRREKPFDAEGTRFRLREDEANPGSFEAVLELCLHPKYFGAESQLQMSPLRMEMGNIGQRN